MLEELKDKYRHFKEWQRQPFQVKPLSKESHTCTTCGTTFEGNYCPRCGLSSKIGRYSFKNAFLLFLDVWGLGNRGMFRTIRDLILRPGYMIRDYLQGMQMAYFPPFKMFFLLITLALLVQSGMNIKQENRIDKVQKEYNEGLNRAIVQSVQSMDNEGQGQITEEKAKELNNQLTETIETSNDAYDWTMKHMSLMTFLFLLLFSLPLYWFFRKCPAYPDIKCSEFFVAMIYITNMITIYSIIVNFFCLSLWLDFVLYALTIIPLKQLSGYSYWRVMLKCVLAFILFMFIILTISISFSFVLSAFSSATH